MVLQSVSRNSADRTIIDIGAPYYWSWAPDGKTMIIHTGSTETSTPQHMSFLDVDNEIIEEGISDRPAPVQAPAWSPNGEHILLTRLSEEGAKELIVTNGKGEFEKTINTFELNTAFA